MGEIPTYLFFIAITFSKNLLFIIYHNLDWETKQNHGPFDSYCFVITYCLRLDCRFIKNPYGFFWRIVPLFKKKQAKPFKSMKDAKIMIDSYAFKISNLFSHFELEKHIDFFGGDVGTFIFIYLEREDYEFEVSKLFFSYRVMKF